MFEFRRYTAGVKVLLPLLLLLLCFEALHLKLYPYIASVNTVSRAQLQNASARAMAMSTSQKTYSAIIGNSSGIDGFDLAMLKKGTGHPWANFSIRGGTYITLENLSRPIMDSQVRLDVAIVPMHPLILGVQRNGLFPSGTKTRLSSTLEILAYTLQGVGYRGTLSVDPEEELGEIQGAGTRHNRVRQIMGWRERGVLEESAYPTETSESIAVRRMLKSLSKVSNRVLVVKMPEETVVQDNVPGQADVLFARATEGYEVLDLQKYLQPEDFADCVHPNQVGRKKITEATLQILSEPPGGSTGE